MTRIAIVLLVAIALLFGIAISPAALHLLAIRGANWTLLANIGQSYGAVSAILSAVALIGVVLTLYLQSIQTQNDRIYAVRESHKDILKMALNKNEYLEVWGDFSQSMLDRDVHVYAHLVINYIIQLYETTRPPDFSEARVMASEMFAGETAREYWRCERGNWLKFSTGRQKKLIDVIDQQYHRSVEEGPAARGIPSKPAASSEPTRSYSLIVKVLRRFGLT